MTIQLDNTNLSLHLRVMTSKHRWFQRNPNSNPLIRLRSADDVELRNTLDGDVNRLVLSTDIVTFAVRILLVADGNKLPVAAAPPAGVVPLAGHIVPLVRPTLVRVLRDEGLKFVWAVVLDVDVVADVRLESTTV